VESEDEDEPRRPVVRETKRQAKARLQEEDRWKWFLERRDALKAEGLPPKWAYRKALASFQPVKILEPKDIDWRGDLEWVYNHLGDPSPPVIPSQYAMSLHHWARANLGKFFNMTVKYLRPSKKELTRQREEERRKRAHAEQQAYLDRMLREAQERKSREREEQARLAAQPPPPKPTPAPKPALPALKEPAPPPKPEPFPVPECGECGGKRGAHERDCSKWVEGQTPRACPMCGDPAGLADHWCKRCRADWIAAHGGRGSTS
jgi:hypothetical protein